jgi:hypothetical protein
MMFCEWHSQGYDQIHPCYVASILGSSLNKVAWTTYDFEWWVLPKTLFYFKNWPCLPIW